MDILNVIHAVIDYKKHLQSYHVMLLDNKQFNTVVETEKFYYSLDLPEGMSKNKSDFERILSFENRYATEQLEDFDNTEESDLCMFSWKTL